MSKGASLIKAPVGERKLRQVHTCFLKSRCAVGALASLWLLCGMHMAQAATPESIQLKKGVQERRGGLDAPLIDNSWPKKAFEASTVGEGMRASMGTDLAVPSNVIEITAPDLAEDGSVVPVTVASRLPAEAIAIFVEDNPQPLAAEFVLFPGANAYVSTRIKMARTSTVIAVVKSGGRLFSARKEVRVTIGGSAESVAANEDVSIKMRAKHNFGSTWTVQALVTHPLNASDFVRELTFEKQGTRVLQVFCGPWATRYLYFGFDISSATAGSVVTANVVDSHGKRSTAEVALE